MVTHFFAKCVSPPERLYFSGTIDKEEYVFMFGNRHAVYVNSVHIYKRKKIQFINKLITIHTIMW
ncbi:MAG: hypothetical protein CML41_02190 [Rhodobacteraceae bacterium]|nr:hypothetical protein [Paracoccaceae bacterium]